MPRAKKENAGGSRREFAKLETFEVRRANEVETKSGNSLVYADVTINGVTVYGCQAITYKADGKEKDFLGWPEKKGNDGNYYKIAYCPLSDADQQRICDAIYAKLDNPD